MTIPKSIQPADVALVVLVGAGLLVGISYWMRRGVRKRTLKFPQKWEAVAKVDNLIIYPVKSLKGRIVSALDVDDFAVKSGANIDRQFMLVNKVGRLVSGRSHPRTVLITAERLPDNRLVLTSPDADVAPFELMVTSKNDLFSRTDPARELVCNLHGRQVKGLDMGDEVSQWLTETLVTRSPKPATGDDESVRLVYHHLAPGQRKATSKEMDLLPLTLEGDKSLFQDQVVAAHMLSVASLTDLNGRLKESDSVITADHFRPNVVVSGCDAYAEDGWDFVKIGSAVFRNTRACTRCVFTTVDPVKGEKSEKNEPLTTLRKYRKEEDPALNQLYNYAPKFGVMLCTSRTGTIAVGDVVYAGRSAA